MVLALVMFGAVSLDYLVKLAVARTRPASLYWAVSATGSSFPSGHASESTAVYLTLAHLFAGTQKRLCVKLLTCVIGILAPFLIGISRVYLRSSLAYRRCHRLGARRYVVGDRARLELCGPVDRLRS